MEYSALVTACVCSNAASTTSFTLQYVEVYQNVVTDLLTGRPVRITTHEDSIALLGRNPCVTGTRPFAFTSCVRGLH